MFIVSQYSPHIKTRMIDQVSQSMFMDEQIIFFSKQHEKHYLTAINMFKDNYIFGIGPKIFRQKCEDADYISYDGCSTHPHNSYIQLLTETGIIGTIPVVYFYLYLFFRLIKNSTLVSNNTKEINYESILLLSILLSLFPLMPSQSFFNNWISLLYYIPLGFVLERLYSNSK